MPDVVKVKKEVLVACRLSNVGIMTHDILRKWICVYSEEYKLWQIVVREKNEGK